MRIGAAQLVSPSAADAYYGASTTSTNSIAITGQPLINAPHIEYVEVARALENNPDQIYALVRNSVDTTFTYGVGKGGLGALIDRSGSPFDQAQLLVGLFRAAGVTAGYRTGTIQLTGPQFSAWTGITSAAAACRLLANGGIPAAVNGTTLADCGYGSATVSSVVLSHVWVAANIGGATYLFDPSYKPYTIKTGVPNLATAAGLTAGQPLTQAVSGSASTTVGAGVPAIRSLSATNLANQISARAATLSNYVETHLPDGGLSDLIGGRSIIPAVIPAGGVRQTALPYPTVQQRIWSGNIPNQYRASVNVAIAKQEIGSTGLVTAINHLLYVDDVYGRKLVLDTAFASNGSSHSGALKVASESSGSVTVASYTRSGGTGTASSQNVNLNDGDITLTVNAPYAAAAAGVSAAGSYMDVQIHKDIDFHIPLTIVTGWGETRAGLLTKWGSRNDASLPPPQFPGGCETCGVNMPGTKGDGRRELIAATWMVQASRSAALHAQIARATYQHHYSVGVVSAESWVNSVTVTSPPQLRQDFSIPDSADRVDIDTGFSVTSWTNDATSRRAAIHAISTTLATLEGSVVGQVADIPDVTSTASRFEWGNAPPAGEDEAPSGVGARRFLRFDSTNAGQAFDLVWTEGRKTSTTNGTHGGTLVGVLGSTETTGRRTRLAEAIGLYSAAGFKVTASEDAFLGPGQRGGYFDLVSTGLYRHRWSRQRGGAFVATRTDVSGEPVEIAHVTVGPYRNAKGGGAGVETTHAAHYDPAKLADLLKDPFVDRSSAAGVDLASGAVSYTSPASLSVGQGDFPYSLSASVAWRGGQPEQFQSAPRTTIPPNGPITTNWNNQLSISSSATMAMEETDVRGALGTVAAFMVMQDIYKSSAITEVEQARRDVVGLLSAAWWARHVTSNVVSVTLGTGSTQFLRRADGHWFIPGGGSSATVTQIGARTPYAKYMGCGDGSVTYVTARGWKYDGMSFQVRNPDGDVQTFEDWEEQTVTCRTIRGFRMTEWNFSTGVEIDLVYGTVTGQPLQRLLEVRNNLGLKISFIDGGAGGFRDGLKPSRQVLINRDPMERPLSVTDPMGNTHRFDFSNFGASQRYQLNAVYVPSRPNNAALAYTYDSQGRVKEARDALAVAGQRAPHQFFVVENFRGMRQDPAGGKYQVAYDQQGRPVSTTDEVGRTARATFDGRGRVKTRTSAWGDVTSFEYDLRGNVTEVRRSPKAGCGTDPHWCQTSVVTATYHPVWDKPLTITLPATIEGQTQHTWTFAYNSAGQVISQTSPAVANGGPGGGTMPAVWQTQYNDPYGRPTLTVDPTGIQTRLEYGTNGQAIWCLSRQTAAYQATAYRQPTTLICNTAGDVTATTDSRGHTSTATFDAMRRQTGAYGPTATAIKTEWTYDIDGNRTHERRWDAAANVWRTTTTTFSLTGKALTVTDPAGDVSRTCYDAVDRARVSVDPTGRASRTSYNLAGQPTLIERWFTANLGDATCTLTPDLPSGVTTHRWREIQYNSGGLQSAELDGNGNITTMTYDGLGRHMLTTYADGKFMQFLRNERDQVYITLKRGGDYHQAFHDALGRVYRVWEHGSGSAWPVGRHSETGYDLAGRPTRTFVSTQTGTTYDATQERDIRTYVYDPAGRVEQDRVRPNNGAMGSNELALTYVYDLANNRTAIIWPDGYRATYRYDGANRADRVQFGPSGNPTQHQADIANDSLSRRTGVARSNGVATSYGYESDSDLASLSHTWAGAAAQTPATLGYQHDGGGRITAIQVNRPDLEWMPTLGEAASYGVPSNLNQMTSVNGTALTWDNNGNLDQYGNTDYQWTWGNRLWKVIKPASTTEYAYDSLDRRTVVIEDGVMVRTLWSGSAEIGEYDTSGALKRRFIPDGSGAMDARLAAVSSTGIVSWFHTDHQGSVVAMSNSSGVATALANYSPHGKFGTTAGGAMLTAPPGGSPFGYTGRQWDAKAELYQHRARYYDPVLGVFLSMDPIGTADDPNLYGYVRQDPVNHRDPTGLAANGNTCSRIGAASCAGTYKSEAATKTANSASPTAIQQPAPVQQPSPNQQPPQPRTPGGAPYQNPPPPANDNAAGPSIARVLGGLVRLVAPRVGGAVGAWAVPDSTASPEEDEAMGTGYHYTTMAAVHDIQSSGMILPHPRDPARRVYFTTYRLSANDVNDALFIGARPDRNIDGVVVFKYPRNLPVTPDPSAFGGLIHTGPLRNGRQIVIVYAGENPY